MYCRLCECCVAGLCQEMKEWTGHKRPILYIVEQIFLQPSYWTQERIIKTVSSHAEMSTVYRFWARVSRCRKDHSFLWCHPLDHLLVVNYIVQSKTKYNTSNVNKRNFEAFFLLHVWYLSDPPWPVPLAGTVSRKSTHLQWCELETCLHRDAAT